MLEGALADIYIALWQSRPHVLYQPPRQFPHPEEAGKFMLTLNGRPWVGIWIRRELPLPACSSEPDVAGASLRELLTLAHELGHWRSHDAGTYEADTQREERRAWAFAEDLLRAEGFTDWASFSAARTEGLAGHERNGTPE